MINKNRGGQESISIIIPAYNAEKFIHKCLKSILEQDFLDFKIYVIDDCSIDLTCSIVEEYAEQDERVLLIKNEINRGPSISRNIGLERAMGKYLLFMDADDWYASKNVLSKLIATTNNQDPDCVCFGYITVHKGVTLTKAFENKSIGEKTLLQFAEDRIRTNASGYHYIWNKLYRSSIIKDNNILFNPLMLSAEDVAFNEEILKYLKKIIVLKECFYCYNCTNSTSLTRGNQSHEVKENEYFDMWNYVCQAREHKIKIYTIIKAGKKSFYYIDLVAYKFMYEVLCDCTNRQIKKLLKSDPRWNELEKKIGLNTVAIKLKVRAIRCLRQVKKIIKYLINRVR